jgi:hypothetical protein
MQLVAGVAGAVVGFAIGGPAGAQIGFALGSSAYGLFGPKPAGPGPGDLKRPQLTLGAQIPRVYGRTRRPVQLVWTSAFRATEIEQGGKGAPEGPSSYTYSLDLMGWIADGSNVIGITRIWVNNKLYYTALSDSTAESIAASAATPQWDDFEFLPGTGAQTPWAVYEDAVGASEAPAYRGVASIGFENFQCGSSKQVPFIEVEVMTSGTVLTGIASLTSYGQVGGLGGSGSFGPGGQSDDSFLDGNGGIATGEAFLAYFVFERDPGQPAAVNNVFLEVGGVGIWTDVINWAENETDRAVSVQLNAPPDHTAYNVGFTGSLVGSFNFGLFCLNSVTVWRSVVPAQQLVESDDPAFGVVTDGAGNYRRVDVDLYANDLWGSNTSYTDNATPGLVDLADIVDAELARVPGLDPSDWDSSDLVGVDVTGFTAIGSAAQALGDLGDIYHFDLVPGAPMRFVRRASATVGSIAFSDTGAGVGEPGEPFTGLKIGNNDESPAVVGLGYPNIAQDHDVDFQSGDRLTTDGPDIRRVETNVVLTPAEARGRAFSSTVMQRSAAKTASFGISDAYAAAEPGDAYAVTDIDGNAYNLRIKRLSYADGVKQVDWELNDISALVDELDTETDYEEAITVAPVGTATLLLVDGPLLRDADDGPGFYAAITIPGNEGVTLYGSADDVTYAAIGTVTRSATTGACTELGAWAGGWTWDEVNTVTVTLESGSAALSSSTHAAMYADASINVALVGAHGRWELIRYRNATLVGTRTYLLSGLMRGLQGTEFAIDSHAEGDTFVLAADNGLLRVTQLAAEIGVLRYFKAVPDRRAVASVAGQSFTCDSECLVPRAVVDIRAVDGEITWDRRTRLSAPIVGEPPLGEASESYQVQLYDALDVLVSTTIVDEPRMPFGQAVQASEVSQAMMLPSLIGGVLYGIWDWGTTYHDRRLIGRNVSTDAGTYLSPSLCNGRVDAVVYVGTTAYVAATDVTPGGVTDQTYLRRLDLSAPSAIAATWSPTPYDQLSDLYWDGTYIWSYGRASGALTQHNATTLAVINSYDAPDRGGISFGGAMAAGGGLFYAISAADEVQGFDPTALPAVTWTADLAGTSAYDLLYAGSLLFVWTNTGMVVLDPSDGTVVESYTDGVSSQPVIDGSNVVYEVGGTTLRWLDGTTGAVDREIAAPAYGALVGATGGQLALAAAVSSSLGTTRLYDVIASLTGYTVRVAQVSETVGAGHEAEITL